MAGRQLANCSVVVPSICFRAGNRTCEGRAKTVGKPRKMMEQTWMPSGKHTKSYWKWPLIVDLPIQNGGSFHGYVAVYQRVTQVFPGFSTRTSGIPARRLDASRFHLPFLVLDSRQQRRHHAVLKCHAGSRMINIWWCDKILPDDFEISESSSFQQRDENKWHVWNHHPSVYHLCHHWTIEFPSAVNWWLK